MRRILLSLSILALLAAAPAYAFFSLSSAKNAMVDFLLEQLSTEGEFEITAEEVSELEEGSTAIKGLKIADANGVWFTADSLSFTWDASRLLSGEVEFNTLIIRDVNVLRAPVQPPALEVDEDVKAPEEEEGVFVWPRSPITLRIDRLALERVTVARAVLGHAIRFDAEGSARDEGDIQSVTLKLKRGDRVAGQIDFAYARDFSDNTLKVDLNANEAAGGLVAHLLGLPQDAASSVTLIADGPPTDWKSRFELDLAEIIEADGRATISYEGPLKIDAAFTARPGPQLPPDLSILLGDQAELAARVSQDENGTIRIAEGQISSPEVKLAVEGSIAPKDGASDLNVDLTAGPRLAQPFDGVEFGGLAFKGRVTGPAGDIRARGDLRLQALKTAPADVATADLSIDVRSSGARWARLTVFDISGGTTGLRLDRIGADVIGDARLVLQGTANNSAVALKRFALESIPLTAQAAGAVDLETGTADLEFDLTAPRLAPVAGAYGVDAKGSISLKGTVNQRGGAVALDATTTLTDFAHPMADAKRLELKGQVRLRGEKVAFDLSGNGEQLRLDRIDADLLPRASLAANGSLDDGTLTLKRFELNSPLLTATAAGHMEQANGTGRLQYTVATPDLAVVARRYDAPLSGVLAMRGVAELPGEGAPRLDGDLTLKDLIWDGTRYGDLTLDHDVRVSEAPGGTIKLDLDGSPYGDVRIATDFAFAAPRLDLDGLTASAMGLSASGNLSILTDAPLADGQLAVTARDLAPVGRLAGAALRGNGSGTITLAAAGGRQDAKARLSLRGLSVDGTAIGGARVDAALTDLLGRLRLLVDAKLTNVAAGDAQFTSARLRANGPLDRLAVTADVSGTALDRPLSAAMSARVNAGGPTVRATISRLDGSLGEDRIALNSPLQITARDGVTRLKGLDLSLPDKGRLSGDLTLAGRPIAGSLSLDLPSLAFVNRFADLPVRKGGVRAGATFNNRGGSAEITTNNLEFEEVDAAGALDITANAAWKGRRLTLTASAKGSFGDPVRVTADLPLRRAGGLPEIARRGRLDGKVNWSGEIGNLWALVPAPGQVVTGATVVDLGVAGDISAPQLTGGVRISDGTYQNLDLGTILTGLNVETSLLGGGDLGLKLTAKDGAAGTVTVDGRVALDASGIDLTTRIDKAVLVRRDEAIARIDGDIAIKGPANALDITGKLVIEEAEIRLVNASTPSIVTLGDVRIKGAKQPRESASSSTIDLDLSITSPGRIFVRGRGLDSKWGADLRISGTAAQPILTGKIERERGQLDLIGKAFDLTKGAIVFDGGRKIDPKVDVQLTRSTSDLTGNIVVSGYASAPELSFTSTPAFPEDEVLPRLLFGKSRQALTGSQAIQLSLGIATLMDGEAGTLDKAREAIGLDSLKIEQDDEGNASVTVGKEVADGVFVGTEKALDGDGGTKVTVEIDIFEDITIDTEVDSEGGASVGVEWKKDF